MQQGLALSAETNLRRLYPEVAAGGFSRSDGAINFYARVNALLSPSSVVLDLGAGRGARLLTNRAPWRTQLCTLKGKVAKVVGADVDEAVLSNPFVDEAHVIACGKPLPFGDASFDMIVCDWVLEHVADPKAFAAEAARVLKPGGWLCARTPNRWGVIGIGANLVPNRLHAAVLAHLQPQRSEIDIFPTTYRLNTRSALRRFFPRTDWLDCSYISNSEPPYVQRSALAMALMQFYWRLTPAALHTILHAFLQKR